MVIFNIFFYALMAIVIIVFILFMIVTAKFMVWFHFHQCKHCGHNMVYRGLREDKDTGYYLFHCNKCGAWDKISKESFFRNLDKDCDPTAMEI